jgi:hypothetical protein
MEIIPLCTAIMPFVLVIYGALGLLKVAVSGPREMPKDHPLNRTLSLLLVVLGLGIYLIIHPEPVISTIGIAVSSLAFLAFIYYMRQARRLFPELSQDDYFKQLRKRYRFMNREEKKPAKKED